MYNDDYEPKSDHEEAILDTLRESDTPLAPRHISNRTEVPRSTLAHHFYRLMAAGWIGQRDDLDGMYIFIADPREMEPEEIASDHRARADEIESSL